MNMKTLLALVASAAALAACGGGAAAPSASNVSGTAATGAPIALATLNAYDSAGRQCATGTTAADGHFTLDVSGCGDAPALLSVLPAGATVPLTSLWKPGQSNVNVTTWTDAIVRSVLGSGAPQDLAALLSQATLVTAIGNVDAAFANFLQLNGENYDPLTSSFIANGSGMDGLLDASVVDGSSYAITIGNTEVTISSDGTWTAIDAAPGGSQYTPGTYQAVHYLQDVDGSTTGAAATDTSADNGYGGNQTYQLPGGQTLHTTNLDNLDQDYWWAGLVGSATLVRGIGASPVNPYMAGTLMVCQAVANTGIGGTDPESGTTFQNLKSTDVLVNPGATRITSAADLAGVKLSHYVEDCFEGGTIPATVNTQTATYNAIQFDADGNATVTHTIDGILKTDTVAAAEVTSALNGTPFSRQVTDANGTTTGYFTFTAYTYTSAYGQKKTVVIEHGAPQTTTLSRGYVALWTNSL